MTTTTLVGLADSVDETTSPALKSSSHRTGRELVAAAREFAKEDRSRSWFHFVETFGVFGLLLSITVLGTSWWVRLPVSILLGLVIVRCFILYHDFMHGAILRGSTLAKCDHGRVRRATSLTPPNVWRQTHNYHHAHTAKIVGSHVGSYLMVTTDDVEEDDARRSGSCTSVMRHPLTILLRVLHRLHVRHVRRAVPAQPEEELGLAPRDRRCTSRVVVAAWRCFGRDVLSSRCFLPLFVAHAVGAYLFYAQHNFPEAHIQPRESWSFTRAALESSSYMEIGPVMHWLHRQHRLPPRPPPQPRHPVLPPARGDGGDPRAAEPGGRDLARAERHRRVLPPEAVGRRARGDGRLPVKPGPGPSTRALAARPRRTPG